MQKKPRLGQNFLVDADACRAVSAALGNIEGASVVEIGPGQGAITRLLAKTAGSLTLVEFDSALAAALREEFALQSTVRIVDADILDVDLTGLAKDRAPLSGPPECETEEWASISADSSDPGSPLSSGLDRKRADGSAATARGKLVIIGNLPYYITSDILLHLVEHHSVIDRAVLMVQREVAERITALPGSSDYGVLSATMQLYGSVDLLFTLPPTAFAPPPEVYSSVIRWHIQPRLAELAITASEFIPFMRASFAQKRKTWANNLRNAGYGSQAIRSALEGQGLPSTIRAEAVDLRGMAAVLRQLKQLT